MAARRAPRSKTVDLLDVEALVLALGAGAHRPTDAERVNAKRLAVSESAYWQALDTCTLRASHRAAQRRKRRPAPAQLKGQGALFNPEGVA